MTPKLVQQSHMLDDSINRRAHELTEALAAISTSQKRVMRSKAYKDWLCALDTLRGLKRSRQELIDRVSAIMGDYPEDADAVSVAVIEDLRTELDEQGCPRRGTSVHVAISRHGIIHLNSSDFSDYTHMTNQVEMTVEMTLELVEVLETVSGCIRTYHATGVTTEKDQ